ncbi:phycobilisome degradation protein NblB [Microcoleus sp. FACHB-68]|uniref:phycobilisome degradation protein NblB n=1 Tax=Microcoleus sp. FACHB-68 TaxID=2692826 RepID=UPI0016854943|nr:HEAT repeat domain-containing protein [Microcoleus sp. FACHB-68]MBD1938197.1 HEAT repeat domain-containing protein [Microcoleus sp. FACHB-68]
MSITPESVRQQLNSEDLGERLRSVNQLRQLEPAIAFELAQTAIQDSNARVRYAAASQMASLGRQDLQTALNVLRDRLIHDPEPDVQAAAADSLGGLQLKEAFEDLQQLYQTTPEWIVKFSIVAALGELGDERSFDLLENALNAGEDLLTMAAISSFGELGDQRAIPLLTPFATHDDWQIRYRVAQALTRFGGSDTRSTLESLANDDVEQVAQEAKTGLTSA